MNKIDTLNRTPFVEQVFNLIETISSNQGNTTFAIDGTWGCGKSFILDMLEEKLINVQDLNIADNKYFVIKYNCWQYDFYEEPLIAFVSAIINIINSKKYLIKSSKEKTTLLNTLKKIGLGICNIGNEIIKNKVGVDIISAIEPITTASKEIKETTAKQLQNENQYDSFYAFKENLERLKSELIKISKKQSVIIIVDELDRCLPQYAIKVLERLHHITEDLSNTITVIATDKSKLKDTVHKIYGFDTDTANVYLKKFINFEIQLNNGINDENVFDKYEDFIQEFDSPLRPLLGEYIKLLFKDISPREQEHLFEKAQMVHNTITKKKFDITVLCVELFLVVISKHYGRTEILDGIITKNMGFPLNCDFTQTPLKHFESKIQKANYGRMHSYEPNLGDRNLITINNQTNIYGIVLWYVNQLSDKNHSSIIVMEPNFCHYDEFHSNLEYIKIFADTLKFIK